MTDTWILDLFLWSPLPTFSRTFPVTCPSEELSLSGIRAFLQAPVHQPLLNSVDFLYQFVCCVCQSDTLGVAQAQREEGSSIPITL